MNEKSPFAHGRVDWGLLPLTAQLVDARRQRSGLIGFR